MDMQAPDVEGGLAPPPPPPAAMRLRRGSRPRRWLALLVAGLVVFAVAFLVVDDVRSHKATSDTESKLAASTATVAKLNSSMAAEQTLIDQINAKLSSDEAIIHAPTFIYVQSSSFSGACTDTGCPMSATVVNQGVRGSGIIEFQITPANDASNILAQCTAAVGPLEENATATVSCSAGSSALNDYFNKNGTTAKVVFHTSVQNT